MAFESCYFHFSFKIRVVKTIFQTSNIKESKIEVYTLSCYLIRDQEHNMMSDFQAAFSRSHCSTKKKKKK